MKISIITVCLNARDTIEDAIQSVVNQSCADIEYIIVDGGSTDGTLEIIERYKNRVNTLISEKDAGIYDAMNKGIRAATGDIVGILNADDFYSNHDVLQKVVDSFNIPEIQVCYGDLEYVSRGNPRRVVRRWKAGEFRKSRLGNGWTIPHPTCFAKKNIYDACGLFNLDFSLAADYELMLRWFVKHDIKPHYIPATLARMREGGKSATNVFQRIKGWRELRKAWRVNGLRPPLFFLTRRILSKVHQYIV